MKKSATNLSRRAGLASLAGLALAAGLFAHAPAWAQARFTKPIRFIVPYPPGGPTDLTGRVFAERLSTILGTPVIVENKPGAQGVPAMQQFLQIPADGHAIYFGTLSTQVVFPVISAYRKQALPYDARKDVVPVSLMGGSALAFASSTKANIGSFKELIAAAKANPGKLNFGSDGIGSLTHLGGEMLNQMAGMQTVHIPYKGTAEFTQALISGDIQYACSGIVGLSTLQKSGKAKVLAIAGEHRSDLFPDVPTTGELGYPGLDLTSWFGVFMKAGTPKPYVDAVAKAIVQASLEPEVIQRLSAAGVTMGMSGTPEQFQTRLDTDFKRWSGVVEKAAIKFEN
ncbi:Bug family tripartite tricarboxylate transporter substrate binding protein [Variovorax sp. PBL-E5]|uniref:Bug family tripartite tricarboxylate transporter substrate binding protein n=1 Tax=Variovorax sp. PBL-E5 TaxID=434014 RepID=UPI001317FA56|nr:tripartite tricarboxylate transporter substrate binding protein [Variovorax sp. PBL-E5]VTU46062.1 Argininosuccinate lyase [Variovorax sp. PBL-E5]